MIARAGSRWQFANMLCANAIAAPAIKPKAVAIKGARRARVIPVSVCPIALLGTGVPLQQSRRKDRLGTNRTAAPPCSAALVAATRTTLIGWGLDIAIFLSSFKKIVCLIKRFTIKKIPGNKKARKFTFPGQISVMPETKSAATKIRALLMADGHASAICLFGYCLHTNNLPFAKVDCY